MGHIMMHSLNPKFLMALLQLWNKALMSKSITLKKPKSILFILQTLTVIFMI